MRACVCVCVCACVCILFAPRFLANPGSVVGYRIKLIDPADMSVLDVYDVGMATVATDGGLSVTPTANTPSSCSACSLCVRSRALTMNYNGRYMKSGVPWTIIVQV